jgi:hypothetical protein
MGSPNTRMRIMPFAHLRQLTRERLECGENGHSPRRRYHLDKGARWAGTLLCTSVTFPHGPFSGDFAALASM